jgi:hypothetical protein
MVFLSTQSERGFAARGPPQAACFCPFFLVLVGAVDRDATRLHRRRSTSSSGQSSLSFIARLAKSNRRSTRRSNVTSEIGHTFSSPHPPLSNMDKSITGDMSRWPWPDLVLSIRHHTRVWLHKKLGSRDFVSRDGRISPPGAAERTRLARLMIGTNADCSGPGVISCVSIFPGRPSSS